MRRLLIFAALATIATALLALPTFISSAGAGAPVSVIVELRDDPAAVYKAKTEKAGGSVSQEQVQAYRDQLRASQDQFLNALSSLGINYELKTVNVPGVDGKVAGTIQFRYTLVYNGLALNVPAAAVSTIKGMYQVKGVHANTVYSPQLDHSVAYVRAPEVYGARKELTQYDDYREGFEGQGMKVAVIDTGITWQHAMFGGDPTPPRFGLAPPTPAATNSNQKVIYYLPLIEALIDDYGHGTHVSGDIAGYLAQDPGPDQLPNTADDVRMHGVAPQAKLMGYKVCSGVSSSIAAVASTASSLSGVAIPYPVRRCESSSIIMAIEDSVSPFTLTGQPKPVADIINLSLGGGGGPDEPSAIACDNAVLAGSIVVASAGNSGPGESTVGSPAAGRRVIAAGANNDPGVPAIDPVLDAAFDNGEPPDRTDVLTPSSVNRGRTGLVDGTGGTPAPGQQTNLPANRLGGAPQIGNAVAQYYVYAGTISTAADIPASVSGRIAIARSGGTTFANLANSLAAKGAVGAIFIRVDYAKATSVHSIIPAWSTSEVEGRYLLDILSSSDTPGVDPAVGALSEFPIRIKPGQFSPAMANFSSRGPVEGFGQVKPDVTAPGVGIRSATTSVGVPVFSMQSATGYISANGTSFSGPHVAGAATLIKQAHPGWNADMVRTALINTATNLRESNGAPKAGGLDGDSINMQGGGLIDIKEAVFAKALMGVAGDGLTAPTILGSHSYGAVPVVNSRVTHTAPVTVTIRDVSGEGGTYNLSLENNRDLQLAGLNVSTTATSVTVPANGSATFTVNARVDGDLIRSTQAAKVFGTTIVEPIQMQWYLSANRTDGKESLRMPFYLKPSPSLPAQTLVTPQHYEGTILLGDAGSLTMGDGVTYQDIPFEVPSGTFRVEARLDYITQEAQDMDLHLIDPAGNVVKVAGVLGGPELLTADIEQSGTYKYRIVGYANGPVTYTLNGNLLGGPPAPTMQPIVGEFVDAQGRQVDFDGNFTLAWQAEGHERSFEVERSVNNGETWELIASPTAGATSIALTGQPNGSLQYRVRGLQDGKIGYYVTAASNATSVIVDQRTKVDITSVVNRAISNVSLTGGVFQLDLSMTNNSAQTYVPIVDLNVVGITSGSGTVRVINADNGKNGTSAANAALFGYSQKLGPDQQFAPNEVSDTRTFRFQDSASEMFTFDAVVTAYVSTGAVPAAGAPAAPAGGTSAPAPAGSSGSGPLNKITAVVRFTANPLTKNVTAQLVNLNF